LIIILIGSIKYVDDKWDDKQNIRLIKICCICCTIFVSCVNAVKIPENDLSWFLEVYKIASKTNYIDYIYGVGLNIRESTLKEPVYTTLVWLLNKLFTGDVTLFKFFITMLNYLLLNKAIVKFCRHFNFSINETVTGIFLMCFIPYIFTMSLQLVRQFLAGSLLVYLLVDRCFYNKKNWLLIVCMGLIHSSALFFVPFLLVPFMDKPFKENKIYYISVFIALIGIQFISNYLLNSGFLSNDNPLNYAISRASKDTMFESSLPIWKIIVVFIIGISHFYVAYFGIKNINPDTGIRRYCHTLIFLLIFILLNLHQSELSSRFLIYFFSFFPFTIVWILHKMKSFITNIVLVLGMIFFWILYLDIGTWTYKVPANVWITPVFSYFTN
jgi:hypothetical protein